MIETTQELKDFILWCHRQKIQTVKVGTVEVQFSNLAFLDMLSGTEELSGAVKTEERNTSQTLADEPKPNEVDDEEVLFWSAKA